MNRLSVFSVAAATLALLAVSSSWAQKQQPQPSRPPATSSPNATPSIGSSPNREALGPLYINGRVLMETGQAAPEPVSVGLSCGMQTVQTIHTDGKGYFQFVLGAGPQSNVDFSASDDT